MTSGIKPKIGLYHVGNSPTKQLCTRKIAKTGVCVLEHTALAEKCPESEGRTYRRNALARSGGTTHTPNFSSNCHDRLAIRHTPRLERILFDTQFLRRL